MESLFETADEADSTSVPGTEASAPMEVTEDAEAMVIEPVVIQPLEVAPEAVEPVGIEPEETATEATEPAAVEPAATEAESAETQEANPPSEEAGENSSQ